MDGRLEDRTAQLIVCVPSDERNGQRSTRAPDPLLAFVAVVVLPPPSQGARPHAHTRRRALPQNGPGAEEPRVGTTRGFAESPSAEPDPA
ncbi:hypothetical protein CMUS01_00977 [Colletotrichum musicola]|uniref:Uncharacterized protein n=1 Tax=Colletotrichum musicola TaxID=2175873 RepID=A0A8H6NXZ7_9PEZI|nr:hypothetical protein CMUS01_00977 [Colletotrichum musicola]